MRLSFFGPLSQDDWDFTGEKESGKPPNWFTFFSSNDVKPAEDEATAYGARTDGRTLYPGSAGAVCSSTPARRYYMNIERLSHAAMRLPHFRKTEQGSTRFKFRALADEHTQHVVATGNFGPD